MANVKNNRYVMGYSQAEHGDMVVYAPTLEEANALFEDGDYTIEDDPVKSMYVGEEDYDTFMTKHLLNN